MDLLKAALTVENYVRCVRRHIHENPETRWEEDETLEFIKQEMLKVKIAEGMKLIWHNKEAGLVADLDLVDDNAAPLKRLLFRADVDALPVREADSHEIRSKKEGVMHACACPHIYCINQPFARRVERPID